MYYVSLKQFEGPLDLLLHLITKAKVDIKDIFVSQITDQYIEHVQNANEFGRYEVMVGRIYDHAAFGAWWQIQRRKAAPDPWERLRRRRQRKV